MIFLVSTNRDISGTNNNMKARHEFIQEIMGVKPSPWKAQKVFGGNVTCYCCETDDEFNGVHITAHRPEVRQICKSDMAAQIDQLFVNTCMLKEGFDLELLKELHNKNAKLILWFAKQRRRMKEDCSCEIINELCNVGTFGFMSSESDRLLFRSRKKGFLASRYLAFDRVGFYVPCK